MPNGRTVFQNSWLEKELDGVLIKEWCAPHEQKHFGRCILCSEKFDISNSGFAQLRSHHKGKKHTLKFRGRFKITSISNVLHKASDGDHALSSDMQVAKAETLWALRVVDSNMSFKSCTETVDTFKDMFPDSRIAAQMQLKEKKVAYVISHGLSNHFENELKKDISASSSGITIAFDETTNVQIKRQLDIYARYWSSQFNLVTCRYITSVFLGHATADILLNHLLESLQLFNIALNRVICLSMDNPNVNKSLLQKFNEKVKEETGNNTLPLGTCNLHVVNNAFKHLLSSLELNFEEFATDVHYFLKYSSARREDYKAIEHITQETSQFLLRHISSRWLTAGPVAQRLLDQWINMTEYFLKFLPLQKSCEKQLASSERYTRIRKSLNNSLMPSFLAFIVFVHKHFENFSLCFQNEAPKIHLLYGEMNKLIRNIMMMFIKDDIVVSKEGSELKEINIENSKIWKNIHFIEIGTKAKNLLNNVTESEKKRFMLDIRSALISTVKYLRTKLPFANQILKDMEVFQPMKSHKISDGIYAVTRIAKYLNFSENFIDNIRDEWKLLQCDTSAHILLPSDYQLRIDTYWRNIFDLKDVHGKFKYAHLSSMIKSALILPHGNADPERGFSINNAMVKPNFNENTIESLRTVKDAIKNYGGICNVPITLSLLTAVKNSHKAYQEYVKNLKEEEEKLKNEKQLNERKDAEEQEKNKRKHDIELKVNEIDTEICQLRKEKEAALEIIMEGTNRLSKAVTKKNNTTEITVSQTLIREGTEQLKKLEVKLTELGNEKDQLLKKKLKT